MKRSYASRTLSLNMFIGTTPTSNRGGMSTGTGLGGLPNTNILNRSGISNAGLFN
jgi:hypothetical protein